MISDGVHDTGYGHLQHEIRAQILSAFDVGIELGHQPYRLPQP
jgi:hypothetical protein